MAYQPKKAAQLIAYLILKSGGGRLDVLKAIKLVYLVDRESIRRYGFPVLDENHVSMPHGPVNSSTYAYVNGEYDAASVGWADFLQDRENHELALAHDGITDDDLDELSEADIECADDVWAEFGHMGKWQIRDWTHDPRNVPEWEDPHGSSAPIPLQRIMHAVGLHNAEEFAETAMDIRRIDAAFKASRAH